MTLEDALDQIGHHNMAVAVQAAGLARVLDDPTARESAQRIHAEALATHRLICDALKESRNGATGDAPPDPTPLETPHLELKASR